MSQDDLYFRISTGLKNIIGQELITDDFIAIFELVKNSYDAEASEVDIIFRNVRENTGNAQIIIRDDGHGMSLEDIKNKWLFVGYSEKREAEKNLDYANYRDKIGEKRVFAGAKGIGRFSCDRLGDQLVLYSKVAEENYIHKVSTDWTEYEENSQEEFQNIRVNYEQIDSVDIEDLGFPQGHGVILLITSKKQEIRWSRKKILDLKKSLQKLINPSHITPELGFSIYIEAQEYEKEDEKIKYKIDQKFEKQRKSLEKENIPKNTIKNVVNTERDLEIATKIVNGYVKNIIFEQLDIKTTHITCDINQKGTKIFTKLEDKQNFIYEIEEKNEKYQLLKNIRVELFFLNPVAKATFTRLMGIQPVRYGSIFLYKNGFKINPYGNEGDDWLNLETRKAQGYARYLATRELMGRVEILGYQPEFKEVSSRDGGVIKTESFDQLKDFFKQIPLVRLENYVVQALDWDNPVNREEPKTESEIKIDSLKLIDALVGKDDIDSKNVKFNRELISIYQDQLQKNTPDLIDSLKELQTITESQDNTDLVDLNVQSIRTSFNNLVNKQKQLEKELELAEKRALFLEYVSETSGGKYVGLQHQIGLSVENIKGLLLTTKKRIDLGEKINNNYISDMISSILIQIEMINSISMYFSNVNYDLKSKTIQNDLVQYISDYINKIYIKKEVKELVIKNVRINIIDNDIVYNCVFSPLHFMIIIDNLISNSLKANANLIEIEFKNNDDKTLKIMYTDNGGGVSDNISEKIFNFGFTTTNGSGIGLHQVKNIMKEYGWIKLNKKFDEGTQFILKVV